MAAPPPEPRRGWMRSFYWRIGLSFVVLVMVVLLAQRAVFTYLIERSNAASIGSSPDTIATRVTTDLRTVLAQDPELQLQQYVTTTYGRLPAQVVILLNDGTMAANVAYPVDDNLREAMRQMLRDGSASIRRSHSDALRGATRLIRVGGQVHGIVLVLPLFRFG